MSAPAHRARKYLPRLLPYALVVAALPLLAPTCGGQAPGVKAFSKGSLIIPMDACYQRTGTTPYADCPGGGDTAGGDVVKAYGLVYQLLRNDIPVYWVINSQKATPATPSRTNVDVAHADIDISYATGGAVGPVGKYVWTNDTVGGMPANNTGTSIAYHGGPFVVDGSDAAAARIVMQSLKATFSPVNVHVSNVAFSAEVARSMSGNFSNSGGTVAPPIALLNITGGDGRNSEAVILRYLVNAGLGSADFPGAGGVATPTGHGKIYDDLYPADFLPSSCTTSCANGSPCTGGLCASNLVAYGYSILWVPHWCGVDSQGIPAGYTYSDILTAIRGFMNSGHDVMAECASIGTFEGVNNSIYCNGYTPAPVGSGSGYPAGTPAQPTQIQTQAGTNINENWATAPPITFLPIPSPATATASTPFLQIGDFPFTPVSGAIQQFRAAPNPYQAGIVRLVGDTTYATQDYFTWLPATTSHGAVVYLSGHDYSGGQGGAFQIAGSRLVLNTLFNLGASCKATHAACTAQALGTCAQGTRECCTAADVSAGTCQNAGDPFCKPGTPGTETCNGLDDDCDGIVDNHLTDAQATTATGCYPGATAGCAQTAPGSYACQGVCHAGTWSCSGGAWSCVGAGTPAPETCNGLDDDCNGTADDNLTPPGGAATCYTGPTYTTATGTGCQVSGSTIVSCQGECRSGTWACVSAAWQCAGQVLPAPERCESTLKDYNCNGIAGDGCDCVLDTVQPCPYPTYPSGSVTPGLGICRTGTQGCVANPTSGGPNVWGACTGQVLPHLDGSGQPAEICGNGVDDDCNGIVDDPAVCDCKAGDTLPCYPAGSAGCTLKSGSCASGTTEIAGFCCAGVCTPGVRACVAGKFSDACTSAVTPSPAEKCNGKNDTCTASWGGDGAAPCAAGQACVNGVCTIPTIAIEGSCACGYVKTGAAPPYTCDPAPCPDNAGGHVAGTPCAAGTLCLMADGSCPAPGTVGTTCVDPCAGKACGDGAYCSGGACVAGGCTATGCTGADAGKACRDGTCQADPCAGFTCPAGTFCRGNYGESPPVADCVRPCAAVVCPQGQACGADGFCAPDPCATVTCAAGQACVAGACVADPCPPGHCGQNQICVDGRCADDPCAGTGAVACPVGTCSAGQCYDPANPNGYGPPPAATSTTKSGCGCGSAGDSGPMALVLFALGLPLARRRRPRPRRGGGAAGLALLAVLVVLGGPACSKTTKEKPDCETCGGDSCVDVRTSAANCGACGTPCGAGQVCGSGTCIAAAPVPAITAVSPVPVSGTATLTVTGTGFTTGAGTRLRVSGVLPQAEIAPAAGSLTSTGLEAPVDLSAVGTGTLKLQVVNDDRTVSNVWGLAVGTPTPAITGLAPAMGNAGTVVAGVVVTGSNFTSNAVCVQRVGTTETVQVPTARTVPTSLTCNLDLSAAPPSTFVDVMVQNENNVRSPAKPFQAVSPGPPTVSSLSPSNAPQDSQINLLVTGTAFEPASAVEIGPGTAGTATTWTTLPTTYVYSTSVRATLSLASYAAGPYQVHVVSPGIGTSGARDFTVSASAPAAYNLVVSPATPVLGLTGVQLALSGSGFDSGCALEVQPPPGGFRPADSSAFTSPQLLQGTVNLTAPGDAAGTWNVRASCGGTTTAALPFTVASNQASLVSVTPAGGGQGETVAVTLTGGNFLAGMQLQLTTQGGAVEQTVTPTLSGAPPASGATASLSLAGVASGVHLLRAVNYVGTTPAPASNPIAFSVTPGTPAIASVTMASAATGSACAAAGACSSWPATADACALQQPAGVAATIAGSNFGTGVTTVYVDSVITGKVDVSTVLAPGSVVVADASTIQVALDTTTVLPQVYTLTVENPGKPPSNQVPFKVTTTSCP